MPEDGPISSNLFAPALRISRLYFESVTQISTWPSPSRSGKDWADGGSVLAILAVCDAEFAGDFFKGAVALVVEQKIFRLVVGDVDVGIAVSVVVSGVTPMVRPL